MFHQVLFPCLQHNHTPHLWFAFLPVSSSELEALRGPCLLVCSPLFPRHIARGLAHGRCSADRQGINTCLSERTETSREGGRVGGRQPCSLAPAPDRGQGLLVSLVGVCGISYFIRLSIYLSVFGRAGCSLLCGLPLVVASGATLWLQCVGLSLQWLPLLRNRGSWMHGLR